MNIKKYARAIGKYLSDSNYRFLMNAGLGKYNNLSDKKYLERKFECCMGKSLDFGHPQTFNEKLQWLKCMIVNQNIPSWLINTRYANT